MELGGKPFRGIPAVNNTRRTFDLAVSNATWMPPRSAVEVAVPSTEEEGLPVQLVSFDLFLSDTAHAQRLAAACVPLKEALVAELRRLHAESQHVVQQPAGGGI
eukprot:2124395-Prymnesium_polylepis.1